jgi:hypothetical protein
VETSVQDSQAPLKIGYCIVEQARSQAALSTSDFPDLAPSLTDFMEYTAWDNLLALKSSGLRFSMHA